MQVDKYPSGVYILIATYPWGYLEDPECRINNHHQLNRPEHPLPDAVYPLYARTSRESTCQNPSGNG